MPKQPWFHSLVSLAGALGVLALSVGCDRFLHTRQKLAEATFEYDALLLAYIVVGFLIFIGWTALGWYVLISRRPAWGLSLGLLLLGAFVVWAPYAGALAGQPIVRIWLYELTNELAHASGIFIAVLGGLGLLYMSTSPDAA